MNSPFTQPQSSNFLWEGRPAWPSIWKVAILPVITTVVIAVYLWNGGGSAVSTLFQNFHWVFLWFVVQAVLIAFSELLRRGTIYQIRDNSLTIKRRIGFLKFKGRNLKFNKVQSISTTPSIYVGLNLIFGMRRQQDVGDIVLHLPSYRAVVGTGSDRQSVVRRPKIYLNAVRDFEVEGEKIFDDLARRGILIDSADT